MRKVLAYSLLLVAGLVLSQALPPLLGAAAPAAATAVRLGTVLCLAFIMIHVGYEFDIDKSRARSYLWDYVVAGTAAAFPWLLVAGYFVLALEPPSAWGSFDTWKQALLTGRFAAPTSAGVLFAMLAAAGLSATWLFRKARVLAIFDDLDTVLLMIPLKAMIVGFHPQLAVVVLLMGAMLWVAWRWLHRVRLPVSWPWVLLYAALLVAATEGLHEASRLVDPSVPVHLEILLPAFVLGCVLARPPGANPHSDDAREGHQEGPEAPGEQRVSTIVSASFMVLVGLSMPALGGDVRVGPLIGHALVVTVIANLGKMFPVFCYRREVPARERLALAIGMWPRGEVGAGVLVVSLSLGITGFAVQVAMVSLALNLLLTGVFILLVRRLLGARPTPA